MLSHIGIRESVEFEVEEKRLWSGCIGSLFVDGLRVDTSLFQIRLHASHQLVRNVDLDFRQLQFSKPS